MKNFNFTTIGEVDILREAQSRILNRMIGVLEDLQEQPWDRERYEKYRLWSSQYDELNTRVRELEKNKEALSA